MASAPAPFSALTLLVVNRMITSDSSVSQEEPFDKIGAWFIGPIRQLYEIRNANSDGAFLAMSASCAMYERYLIKVGQKEGRNTEDGRNEIGGEDLNKIGNENFKKFWDCMRNGLQHQFQPKKDGDFNYFWALSDEFTGFPEVTHEGGRKYTIKINPWEFAEHVNKCYEDNPDFYEAARSHVPGRIRPLEASQHTQEHNTTQPTNQIGSLQTGVFPKSLEERK
jgi:hypothetical protein